MVEAAGEVRSRTGMPAPPQWANAYCEWHVFFDAETQRSKAAGETPASPQGANAHSNCKLHMGGF